MLTTLACLQNSASGTVARYLHGRAVEPNLDRCLRRHPRSGTSVSAGQDSWAQAHSRTLWYGGFSTAVARPDLLLGLA